MKKRPNINSNIYDKASIARFKNLTKQLAPCYQDVYATDPAERVIRITKDRIEDLQGSHGDWEFLPLYDELCDFFNDSEFDPSRSILIIRIEDPESFDALAEFLNLEPIDAN